MKTFIAFGAGINFYSYVERLDQICEISAFCDNNCHKWGQHLMGDQRICIPPESIKNLENPSVIIMAERESSITAIEEQCETYKIPHQRVLEILREAALPSVECCWPQKIQQRQIHKFIELLVHGTTECNFHCEYCYVWRKAEFTPGRVTSEHTPKEIRYALSQKKLGGPCHINACALGETLLSKDIVSLAYELLDEGHYLSIITNGTITPRIDEILQFPPELLERMFFKLSFHYAELKRTKLLEIFWKNVDKIKVSPCSYSIEITPCDSLVPEIDNLKKEFETRAGGAMPHITFTRDTNKEGLDLLSALTLDEYKNTWSVFRSDLFELKCRLYKKKIRQFCYAGNWSYRINVVNGNLQSCYQQELNGTVFDRGQKVLPLLTVGHGCRLDYCFNNHAFLAWGNVPDISCSHYLGVRDRIASNSVHWVKETYAAAMQQKLYENNFAYKECWSDYEKLFRTDRPPAFILFNSPDYGNLGDHAIAYAEKKLFQKLFPDIEFIEISCEQYIRENLLIRNVIQEKDILLLNGGGYLGSLWLWLEDIAKNIVTQYKKNKIMIFPQTLYFEDSNLGAAEKKSLSEAFNSHCDLTVMLRDPVSYQLAEKIFDRKIKKLLIPDIALTLVYKRIHRIPKSLFCIRDDRESRGINPYDVKKILDRKGLNPEWMNTVLEENIYLDNRVEYLESLLSKISSNKVVVTDRLHAVIFCAITNTPCVALDNVSGKISETYYWLKNNTHIVFCEHLEMLEACLEKALHDKNTVTSIKDAEEKFKKLEAYLKENCFL